MKNKFIKIMTLAFVFFTMLLAGKVSAGRVNFEDAMSSSIHIVKSIDTKRRVVTLGDLAFSYNSTTIIYDVNGAKTDATALAVGQMIDFNYDPDKRYLSVPLATKIWIKSKQTTRLLK